MAEEEESDFTLIGSQKCQYCCRVIFALNAKELAPEFIEEENYLYSKTALLVESNPVHKKKPVLIHNGKAIAGSLLILEYLDETWPDKPIRHEDPYKRAQARFWAKFVDEKIVPAGERLLIAEDEEKDEIVKEIQEQMMFLENVIKENSEYLLAERDRANELLVSSENFLKENEGDEENVFVAGMFYQKLVLMDLLEQIKNTIPDFGCVVLNGVVYFAMHELAIISKEITQIELFDIDKFPKLTEWMGLNSQNSTIKAILPQEDVYLNHIRARIEAAKSAFHRKRSTVTALQSWISVLFLCSCFLPCV